MTDDTKDEIEVTAAMVEAGFCVLCSSGIADDYLGADREVVVDIYRAMIAARETAQER